MTPIMERRPLLHGPIGAALLRLAWPVIAGEALHTAFHLVDIAWVGPLGAWATGAIDESVQPKPDVGQRARGDQAPHPSASPDDDER